MPPANGRIERELQRAHRELPEREHRDREPARREVAAEVGEADAVEDRRREAGCAADELAAADPAPHAEHDEHAREAEREPELRARASGAPRAASGARRRARRAASCRSRCPRAPTTTCCSPNAKSVNGALLTRTAATPRCTQVRRSRGRRPRCASRTGRQREQAEEHAPERDLHRREAAVADLDQHERHAPDRAQQHEPGGPRGRARSHAPARSSSSRKRLASRPPL